jgi:hypothetical protein
MVNFMYSDLMTSASDNLSLGELYLEQNITRAVVHILSKNRETQNTF